MSTHSGAAFGIHASGDPSRGAATRISTRPDLLPFSLAVTPPGAHAESMLPLKDN